MRDLYTDEHGIVYSDPPAGASYSASRSRNTRSSALSPEEKTRYLKIPAELNTSAVRGIAHTVCAENAAPREKLMAVEHYFHSNYEYAIGIQVPAGQHPLLYFLNAHPKPAAHCEYCAAGATVLLRHAGIPCRYVTGFFVTERNEFGDYWVARNRDAHAWVEAYIEDEGWVIVEATPASGMPEVDDVGALHEYTVYAKMLLAQFRASSSLKGVPGTITAALLWCWERIYALIMLPQFAIPVLVVLIAFIGYRWQRKRRGKRSPTDRRLHTLHQLLAGMDKKVAREGFVRLPHETVNAFAERLTQTESAPRWVRDAASWYQMYAGYRFGNQEAPLDLDELSSISNAVLRA